MLKTVVEEYAELYHYTSAAGLQGIVTTQQLRATNISFLNDAEEHTLYLDRRLPSVLERAVRSGLDEVVKMPARHDLIEQYGGYEKAVKYSLNGLLAAIRQTTLSFNEPYITSFCGAKEERIKRHGLLSQWRAYGVDGGYAIVFDTEGLDSLLKEEALKFEYQFLRWGDVNYHDDANEEETALEEIRESEEILKAGIVEFLKVAESERLEPIFDAITALSCLTKHWGFHEEKEVRIVAVRTADEVTKMIEENSGARLYKRVHHFLRGGVPVPYIRLFDGITSLPDKKLPIKAVIVGPHPDKIKRQKSVDLLLAQNGIKADVTVSEIPYLCR